MIDAPSPSNNDQRADDLDEGSALLLRHVLEELRAGNKKAAFLAIAHKVLTDERLRLAKLRSYTSTPDDRGVPFEATPPPPEPTQVDARLTAVIARLPFAAPAPEDEQPA